MQDKNTDDQSKENLFEDNSNIKALSSYIPLAIFSVGFVLSCILFSSLYFAQKDIEHKNISAVEANIQNDLLRELGTYETTMRTIAGFIEVTEDGQISSSKQNIIYGLPEINRFDRLMWIRQSKDNTWKIKDIINVNNSAREFYPQWNQSSFQTLIEYLLSRNISDGTVNMFTDIPNVKYLQIYSDPIVRTKPVGFVINVPTSENKPGMVVGLARLTNAFDDRWLANHQGINDLILSNTAESDVLLQIDRQTGQELTMDQILESQGYTVELSNAKLKVNLLVSNTKTNFIFTLLPYMLGIFGVILSVIIAVSYKVNSQKSRKIKSLSSSYVQKNYELNIELSERERLHNLLFSAEREFRILVDSVSDVVMEISPQGEIIFVNKAWEKVTGYGSEATVSQSFFDYIHTSDLDDLRANFKLVFRGQKFSHQNRLKLATEDGRYKQVKLAITSIRNEDKSQPRLIITITDIEAQQRTQKALSDAEEKYRTIIENAAGGFYQITYEGQLLSTNPALVNILGFETEEKIKQNVDNLFELLFTSGSDKARFLKELEVHGAVKNFENKTVASNMGEIWLNHNARTVKDDSGKVLYLEGSIENISQRKEFEQKLKQAKIESDLANRAKSEFLANMSHELRTPLNAIIGFSEIIKDEVLGPIQNKQYWEYASDIYKSGKSLLTIINEILDVSRIETGERQLNESNVNLNKIVEACFDFAKSRMEEAENLTITNMSEGNLPNIIGEELAIKQIFVNILSNAIKFTPGGGRITLSHELDQNGDLRVSITDTGIGLNEAEIEKALSPFGQIDTALNRSGSGAGLGLNLVNSLAKLHGGNLELFSQKGVGTTVTITFPAKRVAQSTSVQGDDQTAVSAPSEDAYQEFYNESEDGDQEEGSGPTLQ